MSRRALLMVLSFVQTTTLMSATAAAVTLASPVAHGAHFVPLAPPVATLPVRAVVAHVAHARPVVLHTVVRRPRPHRHPVRHAVRRTVVRRVPRTVLSPQALMMRAVARIPGYPAGAVVWALTPGLGHWGVATLGGRVVYISPTVPADRMYDVVAHEWSHILSVQVYGGDVSSATAAMNSWFGGSGLDGAERAADCMAKLLGATWTHYTSCDNTHWRDGARRLLAHQHL